MTFYIYRLTAIDPFIRSLRCQDDEPDVELIVFLSPIRYLSTAHYHYVGLAEVESVEEVVEFMASDIDNPLTKRNLEKFIKERI